MKRIPIVLGLPPSRSFGSSRPSTTHHQARDGRPLHQGRVPHLVLTHMVPPLRNALMRRMFVRGVAEARGSGDTMLDTDGLLLTLPADSKDFTTKRLF